MVNLTHHKVSLQPTKEEELHQRDVKLSHAWLQCGSPHVKWENFVSIFQRHGQHLPRWQILSMHFFYCPSLLSSPSFKQKHLKPSAFLNGSCPERQKAHAFHQSWIKSIELLARRSPTDSKTDFSMEKDVKFKPWGQNRCVCSSDPS